MEGAKHHMTEEDQDQLIDEIKTLVSKSNDLKKEIIDKKIELKLLDNKVMEKCKELFGDNF
jgi:phosphate uptake regulator